MIFSPASLPIPPVIERAHSMAESKIAGFQCTHLEFWEGAFHVIQTSNRQISTGQTSKGDVVAASDVQEQPADKEPALTAQQQEAKQTPRTNSKAKDGQSDASHQQAGQPVGQPIGQEDRKTFWERIFKLPPLRKRLEKSLTEDWKFTDVRPRNIEGLLSEDEEESRRFFLDGTNARQYHKLVKEFGCGFENRNGKIVDDSFETINEYGPELLKNYSILMDNRELIKRYFAGVFRDGRIATQSLIRISTSMWFETFEVPRFKTAARLLHSRFQVPNHVVGPMLSSVGDSLWLRQVLFRKTSPQEFQQLLSKIAAASTEDAGNA
nr:hypothetical protein [Acidobacteriota bacterium]